MNPCIEIAGRRIGTGYPVYVVAELSANHNQSYEDAVQLLHAAKEAGADAIKLQTYTPDTLTIDCDESPFQIHGGLWDGDNLYRLYQKAYTPWEWQPRLQSIANQLGLTLFSTPFDDSAVDFLERMRVPAYKVASFELVDLALLKRIARTGKPMILSTGMATLGEIEEAVSLVRREGCDQIALLKCTSAYPAPPEAMHLRTIAHLAETFHAPAGLSDHTLGIAVPVAAVAFGACIVEKHLTLSRDRGGPDAPFSLEPHELRAMTDAVHIAEEAVGQVQYGTSQIESNSRVFRRSLFVVSEMGAGDIFTDKNVRAIRPGDGLHTRYLPEILGKRASVNIKRGTPLSWGLVRGG